VAQREFDPIFGHFRRNTQILGLIRVEFAVREGKIGGTTPTLAPPLNPDKPKLSESVRDVMRTPRPCLRIELAAWRFDFCNVFNVVTFVRNVLR